MAKIKTLAENLSEMAASLINAQNAINVIHTFNLEEWQDEQITQIDDDLSKMLQQLANILGNVMIYHKAA